MLNQPFPSFGQRVRHQRRAQGLKQLVIAQAMNVDQATVSRWEAGQSLPDIEIQQAVYKLLSRSKSNDSTLRRLVENSNDNVHLVEDLSHICLAYSTKRAQKWQISQRALLGVSLWQFATEEIRAAEAELAESDWWSSQTPKSKSFRTSKAQHDNLKISAGGILWERLYLADGTPVRLVTSA